VVEVEVEVVAVVVAVAGAEVAGGVAVAVYAVLWGLEVELGEDQSNIENNTGVQTSLGNPRDRARVKCDGKDRRLQ